MISPKFEEIDLIQSKKNQLPFLSLSYEINKNIDIFSEFKKLRFEVLSDQIILGKMKLSFFGEALEVLILAKFEKDKFIEFCFIFDHDTEFKGNGALKKYFIFLIERIFKKLISEK